MSNVDKTVQSLTPQKQPKRVKKTRADRRSTYSHGRFLLSTHSLTDSVKALKDRIVG